MLNPSWYLTYDKNSGLRERNITSYSNLISSTLHMNIVALSSD